MREARSKEIGGFEYTVTQLTATTARKLFTQLARLFGGAMEAKEPIAALMSNLKDEDLDVLCKEFAKLTFVKLNDKQAPLLADVFDEHFAGKIGDMFKWLAFCIDVNYGSFLGEIGLNLQDLAIKAKASPLPSPKVAIGGSGE